jgi:hypothetical protein
MMATKTKKEGPLTRFFKTHGWCQYAMAKDRRGHWVEERSPEAVAFCLYGGAELCGSSIHRLESAATKECPKSVGDAAKLNDRRGMNKRKIMAFLRRYGL